MGVISLSHNPENVKGETVLFKYDASGQGKAKWTITKADLDYGRAQKAQSLAQAEIAMEPMEWEVLSGMHH